MTAYFSDPWLTIHEGDCRAVLAEMEPESVHCVVTSPPYWGLRDYGTAGQLGLEETPEQYVAALVDVFREVRRVLRSDGTVWLNLGDTYHGGGGGNYGDSKSTRTHAEHLTNVRNRSVVGSIYKPKDLVGIPWRVAFALQADGWYLRSDIIWSKPNPMPESVTDRPTKSHEYLFLLSKSARYWFDADAVSETAVRAGDISGSTNGHVWHESGGHNRDGLAAMGQRPIGPTRNLRSVWTIATAPYPGAHFATFPPKLVEPCIKAGCPDKACGECGAPWERVVERTSESRQTGNAWQQGRAEVGHHGPSRPGSFYGTSETTGFRPTCTHDAPTVPGVVLDPFAGTGTVGLVAQRLSRRAVLIDLNAAYLQQCLARNAQTPLGLESA